MTFARAVRSLLARGAVLSSGAWLVSCSLAIETASLGAGETASDCGGSQKLCPYYPDDPEGITECVDATSPQRGCANDACEPCEVAGAVPRCTRAGTCGIAICEEGYDDCDKNEATGCEINLLLDEQNCGACGRECMAEQGVANCIGGVCKLVFCNAPYADCVASAPGCETDTDISKLHCGGCNQPCDGSCKEGICED